MFCNGHYLLPEILNARTTVQDIPSKYCSNSKLHRQIFSSSGTCHFPKRIHTSNRASLQKPFTRATETSQWGYQVEMSNSPVSVRHRMMSSQGKCGEASDIKNEALCFATPAHYWWDYSQGSGKAALCRQSMPYATAQWAKVYQEPPQTLEDSEQSREWRHFSSEPY